MSFRLSWRATLTTRAFVVLFPPYWFGLLSADALMLVGHVLMLPAMAIAMLFRREQYLGRRGGSSGLPGSD